MLDVCTVKTTYNGSKLRIGSSNLYQCDGQVLPVRLSQVRASNSKILPVVGRFDCARLPPRAMVVPGEEQRQHSAAAE